MGAASGGDDGVRRAPWLTGPPSLDYPRRIFLRIAGMSRPVQPGKGRDLLVSEVKVRKGETVDKALRRLKKKLDREGLMREIRARRHFEKPSEQKRRKQARARSRH